MSENQIPADVMQMAREICLKSGVDNRFGLEEVICADGIMAERNRCIEFQPSTAEDPNENRYQRGRFDGIMEFARAIRHPSRSPNQRRGLRP